MRVESYPNVIILLRSNGELSDNMSRSHILDLLIHVSNALPPSPWTAQILCSRSQYLKNLLVSGSIVDYLPWIVGTHSMSISSAALRTVRPSNRSSKFHSWASASNSIAWDFASAVANDTVPVKKSFCGAREQQGWSIVEPVFEAARDDKNDRCLDLVLGFIASWTWLAVTSGLEPRTRKVLALVVGDIVRYAWQSNVVCVD